MERMEVEAVVQDALAHVGVETQVPAAGSVLDLTIELDGATTQVQLKRRSLVDGAAAERLLADSKGSDNLVLIVGDRVTDDARRKILAARAGYLDLRGHLGLRARGIVINADVPPMRQDRDRQDALAGSAGLEVAAHLLLSPHKPVAVRAVARDIGRSPSTVSGIFAALRRDELIDTDNTVTDTTLFWRLSERWPRRRTFVATVPADTDHIVTRALRLGLDDIDAPGWALTDTAAAAAYGAPVAFRAGQQLDFLVPDDAVLQRALRLLGGVNSIEQAAVSLRVAPVPAAVRRRFESDGPGDWPLAHPLFVALDLAQDTGRGREVLDAWTPDERWPRVW